LEEVRAAVLAVHGSLEQLRFERIFEIYEHRPYAKVVDRLTEIYSVLQTTDTNYDVSFAYALERDQEESLGLYLSMLGPFALLERSWIVLTEDSPGLSWNERHVVRILRESGIRFIPQEVARQPFRVGYPDWDEDDDMRVAHVLFCYAGGAWGWLDNPSSH
jgi:hypothetical protein